MTKTEIEFQLDHLKDFATKAQKEALDIVISSLEQEPCEDAISREEAIDACNQSVNILEATDRIKDLPPVYTKTKVGKWYRVNNGDYESPYYVTECSECGEQFEEFWDVPYCPMCGAKMEEVEE